MVTRSAPFSPCARLMRCRARRSCRRSMPRARLTSFVGFPGLLQITCATLRITSRMSQRRQARVIALPTGTGAATTPIVVGAPATGAVIGRRAGLALPPTETSRSLLIEMSGGKLACQSRPPKPALDFRAIRPLLLPETLVRANFVPFAVLKRPFWAMPEIVNSITDRGRLNCAETGSERRCRWMQGRSFTS